MSVVEGLVKLILSSRKNANKISELLNLIRITDEESFEVALHASKNAIIIFKNLVESDDVLFTSPSGKSETSLSSVVQYKLWIGERFNECFNNMLDLMKNSNVRQDEILTYLMKLVRLKFSLILSQKNPGNAKTYGKDIITLLYILLLNNNLELLQSFSAYFEYDDVRYVVLKAVPSVLRELTKSNQANEKVMEYVLFVLKDIAEFIPDNDESSSLSNSFFIEDLASVLKDKKETGFFSAQAHRKLFGVAWLEFLKQPLPAALHKEVLINLHSLLIPNFAKPCLLADYLTRSFHQGGGLALLALHGLFVLVNEYNLEYPDFYKNLYTLLHPRIFAKSYKNRFFNLLQQFLSSTHIPSYVVAAFVKKMSRLSLIASSPGVLVMLNLMSSLISTHPSICYLINSDKSDSIVSDPFLEDEQDLMTCKAAQSSLWELDALERHYLPEISKAASIVKKGKVYKYDVDKLLDLGHRHLINFDESTFKSNVMCHVPAKDFMGGYEDITAELWTF